MPCCAAYCKSGECSLLCTTATVATDCPNRNQGTAACTNGVCVYSGTCSSGWYNLDGVFTNGCELLLLLGGVGREEEGLSAGALAGMAARGRSCKSLQRPPANLR